ncbi:hypothetical protein [Campylobacter sp. RM12647]|uniref:hypothetical protein n=1 Tax=Campylobacter sp. RM12647 TaxID=2735737 RepID=UPI001DFA58A9|nr:hypothetical protein [Campylobacter sp. RM12647]
MNITCFGTCDMIWTGPFIKGLKDSGNNILALAHSNTSMGSNIYHLIKYKDKIIKSDLIIIGISEESSRNEIIESHEKLSLYFYNELVKINKKVLVIIWHYVNMYTQDGVVYDYSKTQENLCKHFGFNYIDLFTYFKDKNIFDFYNNQIDKHHPIYDTVYLFAMEVSKNIDKFNYPMKVIEDYNIDFNVLDNNTLQYKNTLKVRNHLQNQNIIKLENTQITFPPSVYDHYLVSIHTWNRALGMDNSNYGLIKITTSNTATNLTLWGWEHIADLYLNEYRIDENFIVKTIKNFDSPKEFRCINVSNFSEKVGIIGFLISNKTIKSIKKIELQNNSDFNFNHIGDIFIQLQNVVNDYYKRIKQDIAYLDQLKNEIVQDRKNWNYKGVKEKYKKIVALNNKYIFTYLDFLYNIGDYQEIIDITTDLKVFENEEFYKSYQDYNKMWAIFNLVKFYYLINIEDLSSNDSERKLYASYKFLDIKHLNNVLKDKNFYKDHWSFTFIINAIFNKLVENNRLDIEVANNIIQYLNKYNTSKDRKKYIVKTIVHYFILKSKSFFNFNYNLIFLIDCLKDNDLGGKELQKLVYSLIKLHGLNNINTLQKNLNNIKVAVCMSGPLRGDYIKSLELLKNNILLPLNADLFVHTWENTRLYTGFRGGNIWHSLFGSEISNKAVGEIINKELLQKLLPNTFKVLSAEIILKTEYDFFNNVNPTNILIDSEKNFENSFKDYQLLKYSRTQNLNISKMFYGIQKSLELMLQHEIKNNIKYDFIIRLRPDVPILEQITLEKIQKIQNGQIQVSFTEFGMDDTTFIGRRIDMIKLMQYFHYVDSLKKLDIFNINEDSPHDTLISYLIYNGLENVDYKIIKSSDISFCTKSIRPDFDEALQEDFKNIQDENLKKKLIDFFEEIKKQTRVVKIQ